MTFYDKVLVLQHSCLYFTDLLIESLFKTNIRLNPEHKSKYIYLLSYAASVTEAYKKVFSSRLVLQMNRLLQSINYGSTS